MQTLLVRTTDTHRPITRGVEVNCRLIRVAGPIYNLPDRNGSLGALNFMPDYTLQVSGLVSKLDPYQTVQRFPKRTVTAKAS